jgi:hypothetical protein
MALTHEDKSWLKETFATKTDLQSTESGLRGDLKKAEERIVDSINKTILGVEANLTGRVAHLELVTKNKLRA